MCNCGSYEHLEFCETILEIEYINHIHQVSDIEGVLIPLDKSIIIKDLMETGPRFFKASDAGVERSEIDSHATSSPMFFTQYSTVVLHTLHILSFRIFNATSTMVIYRQTQHAVHRCRMVISISETILIDHVDK